MNDPRITLPLARLVADPERKQTRNGTPYLLLRFAANGSHKNRQTNQWENDPTIYATVFEFDQRQAETYMTELHKGTPVRIEGQVKLSATQDRNGQPRVDVTINYPTITRVLPKAKQQSQQQPQQSQPSQSAWGQSQDPWGGDFGGNMDDFADTTEPSF